MTVLQVVSSFVSTQPSGELERVCVGDLFFVVTVRLARENHL